MKYYSQQLETLLTSVGFKKRKEEGVVFWEKDLDDNTEAMVWPGWFSKEDEGRIYKVAIWDKRQVGTTWGPILTVPEVLVIEAYKLLVERIKRWGERFID